MIIRRIDENTRERLSKSLAYLLWFVFGCLVLIWFKDSFPFLRKLQLSPLIPLSFFILIFFFRQILLPKQKKEGKPIRPDSKKVVVAISVLLLLATGFRIPFLLHSYGLYTSDHAISPLMAKHIAEGKRPPVFYYGQLYLGSLSEHIFAFLYLLFGYSVFLVKFTTLLFYLFFIAVQFLLLKEIFSFDFSLLVSLFYCLPIGHLIPVSFFNTAPFPLTLLLGTLVLYSAYFICYKDKTDWIPALGFMMGLSFWTHQISMAFILTSLVLFVWRFRLQLRKYINLFVFGLLGSLPFWIHEIQEGFSMAKFLMPGEGKLLLGAKIHRAIDFLKQLFFLKEIPFGFLFLVLVVFGFGILTVLSFKKRTLVPQSLFSIFFFLFLTMYLVSDFSDKDVIRYLYPLYFCLPVLLFAIFFFIKPKAKYLATALLFVSFFSFGNLKEQDWSFQITRGTDKQLREAVSEMEKTGLRYWRGEYWSAYLISALSNEDVVVDSWTQNRYYPYRLDYFNKGENNNFLFLRGRGSYEARAADRLIYLLDTLDIGYKKREFGDSLLVYEVQSTVFPLVFDLNSARPPHIPDFGLIQIREAEGYLYLTFRNNRPVEGQHLRVHVEIPDFSSTFLAFSWSAEKIETRIPFPEKQSFKIKSFFEYRGLRIPSTEQEMIYSAGDTEVKRREDIVNLSGFGPLIEYEGRRLRICEKDVQFEINTDLETHSRIELYLFSPFQFDHPYWYGEYFQSVRVSINGVLLKEYRMEDGDNRIDIELRDIPLGGDLNILSLNFQYHLPFEFFLRGNTAALLDRIEIR